MLTYIYTARDPKSGQKITAEVEAENEATATRLLVERGWAPLELKVKGEENGLRSIFNRIPGKQRIIFSRQLATLVNAGLPLVQSLSSVETQMTNKPLKEIIGKVIKDVEAGSSLANAMAKHPKIFNDVYVSLVAAGEASGTLDTSLERLANQQEKDAEIMSRVRSAFIYPIIVIFVLIAVVLFMMTSVLPQVQNLYSSIPGAELPFMTRILLGLTHAVTHFWWITIVIVVGAAFFGTRYARTGPGKQLVDRIKLRMWPASNLFTELYMARFARAAATLVASGVPIIKMLSTSAQAVGNVQIENAINKAAEDVKGGKPLSDSLAKDPNFPDLVSGMIRVGEQSGQLEGMFTKLADYYEKEVDNQVKSISTIIEPALMVVVGVIALVVVAAVLLPIYSLAGKNLQI
ncbi:MAG TPA: type II secretion system F family protein [Candidatus Saccharimonadales bacterium]|nr:type II secretion system F family protein [Candidatus Saccharimonadales bacterium]